MKNNYLQAEMWDRVQYLFRNYYDGMMHAVFYYDGHLDIQTLEKAYLALIDKIPILRSTFLTSPVKPKWRVNQGVTADEFFSVIQAEDAAAAEVAVNRFITGQIHYKSRCQIRVCVVRSERGDALCVIINHMCADGGDFKAFNIKIAECYTKLMAEGLADVEVKSGTRSADQVYSTMSEEDRAAAVKLKKNVSAVKSKIYFPYAKADNDSCRINRYKIPAAEFAALRAQGKKLGATVNDVLLAAFVRAIYKLTLSGFDLTVPCMADLRRHIKGGETYGFTNLTGFMPCEIRGGAGKDIFETVDKVKQALAPSKDDKFVGLYGLPLLKLAYKVFPDFIAQAAIKIGYQNPLIGMSNIGIIDANAYIMNGLELNDAWYTGAIKYKPYFQLACTTFKGELTLTAAFRGNPKDDVVVEELFETIRKELNIFAKMAKIG